MALLADTPEDEVAAYCDDGIHCITWDELAMDMLAEKMEALTMPKTEDVEGLYRWVG